MALALWWALGQEEGGAKQLVPTTPLRYVLPLNAAVHLACMMGEKTTHRLLVPVLAF